jgi:hypothetical protein
MIILKKVQLTEAERQIMEQAMRKKALKRTSSLDFKSTVTDIGTDKLFLGYDGKNSLQFARLRASFEKYLPKIIIILPKSKTEFEYRLRYSLLSTLVAVFWTLGLVFSTAFTLVNTHNYEAILVNFIFFGGYMLLTMFELKLVSKRIQKAIVLNS